MLQQIQPPHLPAALWPAQQRRRAATFLQDMKTCKENASTWSQRNQMESQRRGEREGKAARSNEITLSSLQQNVCKTWPKALQGKRRPRGEGGIDATIERSIDRLGGANCNWQLEIWVRGHNAIGAFSCPVGPSKRPFWKLPSAADAPCPMPPAPHSSVPLQAAAQQRSSWNWARFARRI